MPLTPDDIVNYPLDQSFRGYSVRQVDELLDQVADELERLHLALSETRRDLERAQERAHSVDATEATLRRTLITAQRAAEETLEQARERARMLVDEAEQRADRLHHDVSDETRAREGRAERRIARLEERLEAMRVHEAEYRERLRVLAERHLRQLEELPPLEPEDPHLPRSGQGTDEDGPDGHTEGGSVVDPRFPGDASAERTAPLDPHPVPADDVDVASAPSPPRPDSGHVSP